MSEARIAALVAELRRDPQSLAFHELVPLLLAQGDRVGAELVAERGVRQHPHSADAKALHAHTLLELGRLQEAYSRWLEAIQIEPRHLESRKGLGFLSFRGGDYDGALDHLEIALSIDPRHAGVQKALRRVRAALDREDQQMEAADRLGEDALLVDKKGRAIVGSIEAGGHDRSEELAAFTGGVAKEAARAARMLGLGRWLSINVAASGGKVHFSQPAESYALLLLRQGEIRAAQMEMLARAAGEAAVQLLDGGLE